MCRLFGVISTHPVNADFCLLRAPRSLFVQSRIDKKRKQGDGWGVGWFEGRRPKIYKSPRPIYHDLKTRWGQSPLMHYFGPLGTVPSRVVLGHVRWASNPLKLPRRELIGIPHTQPFSHGGWLFIHNGTLYIPREVKAALGPWAKYVKGKNDSEVLFYWLLKTVVHGSGKGWSAKIRSSFRQLDRIWQACKSQYPIYRYPYHGLNWVLTNGRVFLAFCYVDPRGFDKAKALCRPGQPYYQLQVKKTERNVIVSSEPLDCQTDWRPLGHGQLLIAEKKGRTISTKTIQVM